MEVKWSDPRYPIESLLTTARRPSSNRNKFIDDIETNAGRLRAAIQGRTPQQIELHIAKVAGRAAGCPPCA